LCLLAVITLTLLVGWGVDPARAAPCDAPVLNPVACENSKQGTPPSQWDINEAGSDNIQGFATAMSVDQGETETFKVDTNSSDYRLDIYRMGYYGGNGARLVTTLQPSANLPQNQPDCIDQQSTGLIDCGNWGASASWQVPGDAVSGIYFAKLVREDGTPGQSHVFFVVRDDDGNSDLLFQTSDTTWQAYNRYGGNSLYTGNPAGRAYKVSYNRPFVTRNGPTKEDWVFNSEYPMVRWLERNGYDVSYFSGIDSDRRGAEIREHDAFLSVGHDEYWSGQQRANVTAARDAGVNLAFFSGNEVFWKTRWENSIDGSGTPFRTLVTYKETHANAKIDPTSEWTGTWRDNRSFNPQGQQPENALTGTIFTVNCCSYAMKVPAADGKMRFWRNTSVANLQTGETATLAPNSVGYEWDEDLDNGFRPPGTFQLSSTTVDAQERIQDQGTNYGPGQATHAMTTYRANSGALVFSAGTIQWPWGLDSQHDRDTVPTDQSMQQATVNLLADMGVQPTTLATNLQAATKSTDVTRPSSTIEQPPAGTALQVGAWTQVSGTATDQGGRVGGVEVSVDGGQTWHPATGRGSWTYSWTPSDAGQTVIKSRAVDDSGNIESPGNGVTVTVAQDGAGNCPCSLWNDSVTAPIESDSNATEVGVKFRADVDGYITGLRFYKGAQNTGTHVGHLWTASGTLLAQATFTNETNSGWQQVSLDPAVPISADTTYVASYLAPNGHYAATNNGFSSAIDKPPLHGLASGSSGGNGVYRYGSSGGFPTQTYQASNYWVDVVFTKNTGADVTPPTVSSVDPAQGSSTAATDAKVTATFSERMNPATISGQTVKLSKGGQQVAATVSYDVDTRKVTLTPSAPLESSTSYTATISGGPSGVADLAGNRLASDFSWSFATAAPAGDCPCSLWNNSVTAPIENDSNAVELGVKFRADVDGFVTGLRFYKGAQNTGTHVGHLWTASGNLLATATFTGESNSGWQQVSLNPAVPITADTTYVASYLAPNGHYAATNNGFSSAVDKPPLHGLASGASGGNGVYRYGASGGFPTQTYQASNYWVDVVFTRGSGPDLTPPTVSSVDPAQGASTVATNATVAATFSERMDPATISGQTVKLSKGGQQVAATVSYDAATQKATLTPSAPLESSTTYTATISGGPSGVADLAGNRLASDYSWSFATAAPPPSDNGPGGPILVIANPSDPFSRYYAEILEAEGLNEYRIMNLGSVTASTLSSYDVAILGSTSLTTAQTQMLTTWVNGGGNLIAMRPASQLTSLLGLASPAGTLANAYLKVDTASSPGRGIVDATMQFHGTADRYTTTSGARTIAPLYSNASTATPSPAVTVRDVGSNGGQAAAFTFDLARSVVYTRQGNPAWAGQERDGFAPIRSDDLFFGGSSADWVDLNKVAIPQADEQQRLLANLIGEMNVDRKPLPRFWYLPRAAKAAIVMTGDDHARGGTAARFNQFAAASPNGCSVADWECVRATSYVYPDSPLTPAQASSFESQGFEVAAHLSTDCNDYTPASLAADFDAQIAAFTARYSNVPAPRTNRTHCVVWSDWASQPKFDAQRGIRLDTTYYYWPGQWVGDRPGMFTGSGFPMRFADQDGSVIDTYQATTQMTDESDQSYPATANALLDRALGAEGYYGAFVANMHTDDDTSDGANAIVAAAQQRGVPIISARQLLTWTDGRNDSSFGSIGWSNGQLSFSISQAAGSNGLEAMVPTSSKAGSLSVLRRGGTPIPTVTRTIKGVEYAFFSALPGSYTADYAVADTTPPVISNASAQAPGSGTASIAWKTDEPADSRVDYGTAPGSLDSNKQDPQRVTDHAIELTGLSAGTTYYYRLRSTDAAGNAATYPPTGNAPLSFTTPASTTNGSLTDTSTADFNGGQIDAGAYVAETSDGELTLRPTVGEEFRSTTLPSGWSTNPWSAQGSASASGGALSVNGASSGTTQTYGSGRSVEFVATFGDASFQHAGLGNDFNVQPYWAIFSTRSGGGLYARTNNNGSQQETQLSGSLIGSPHRYRIDWSPTAVTYYVDGTQVASHATSFGSTQMRPLISDYTAGGPALRLDWLHMTPYTTTGTFTSRVLDAGSFANWGSAVTTATTPAGTSIALSIRTGNTPTPDGSWSAWTPVSGSGPIGAGSRYLQYRADLQSSVTASTPELQSVTLNYTKPG